MQYKQQYSKSPNPKDQWETPEYIFTPLNKVFGFSIDVAATHANRKVDKYYSIGDNGLEESWSMEVVFCNPPHTDGAYVAWIAKAYQEFKENHVTSVLVLPFNSETKGFRPVWKYARYLIRPYSRIKYELNGKRGIGAPFDSCVVVFTWQDLTLDELNTLAEIGYVLDLNEAVHPYYLK